MLVPHAYREGSVLVPHAYREGSVLVRTLVSQIAKPHMCLATIVAYLPPNEAIALHHWSVSITGGATSLNLAASGTEWALQPCVPVVVAC